MKRMFRTSIFALGLASVAACYAQPKPFVRMTGSLEVPSAQGKVTATATANNNTALDVDVEHLAAPGRVKPGATTYIVWARGTGETEYHNLGALLVDQNLHGRLQTVTPMRSFDVMITAEASVSVPEPSSKRVLSASIER